MSVQTGSGADPEGPQAQHEREFREDFRLRGDQDHDPLHAHTPLHASAEPYTAEQLAQLTRDAAQIVARYPQKRSALLPMLHLIQSVDGYVTGRGVTFCAEQLELTDAEVSGVATFYTQYKRHPNGDYTVGVCTNTLCAIMGGDQIFAELSAHLGIGHDETTADGAITLERVECNAACDYAPVVMANWEFFDNQTPDTARRLVDDLRAGRPVRPTRGPDRVCTFTQMSRTLAGFADGLADQGPGAGPASLRGTELARARGWQAPGQGAGPEATEPDASAAGQRTEGLAPGLHGSTDNANDPAQTSPGTSPDEGKADR